MADLEVSTVSEFAWLIVAALVAGLILFLWQQVKTKGGINV